MSSEINNGVRCNVCDCVYNEKGCNCNKTVIDVSHGNKVEGKEGNSPHFCKSYICKSSCCCNSEKE